MNKNKENPVTIVIINGLGGCGKSTFISLCSDTSREKYGGKIVVKELSTVDRAKQLAKLAGWDGGKTEKDRVFLSDIKRALQRWNNCPIDDIVNFSVDYINKMRFLKVEKAILFVNSREQNDIVEIINKAKSKGISAKTLKIVRKGIVVNEVPDLIEYINKMESDYLIENDGDLANLREKAKEFIENLLENEESD